MLTTGPILLPFELEAELRAQWAYGYVVGTVAQWRKERAKRELEERQRLRFSRVRCASENSEQRNHRIASLVARRWLGDLYRNNDTLR